MQHVIGIGLCLIVLGFVWWLFGGSAAARKGSTSGTDELIDPSDPRQIGLLTGLMGGGIADAAAVRFALQRFEEIHGRKATTRDAGTVVGLMRGMK